MKVVPAVLLALLLVPTLASCERMRDWQQAEDWLLGDIQVPSDWEPRGSGLEGATSEGDPWATYLIPDGEQPDAAAVGVPDGFERRPLETPSQVGGSDWWTTEMPLGKPSQASWKPVARWHGTISSRPCDLRLFVGSWPKALQRWVVIDASCQEDR